jgi:nucleoside-diphosphate-sugar epimerase
MSKRALLLGASGQIGRAISENLAADGWWVLAAHRGGQPVSSKDGVEDLLLDRDDDTALKRAVGGGVDALIDVIAFEEKHARQLLALQADVGAMVVISTGSVYSDTAGRSFDEAAKTGFPDYRLPVRETDPTVAPGPETYSTRKALIEQILLNDCRTPVSVLRAGAVYGAGSRHAREWWFIKRMLDRRTHIPLAYDGLSRFHLAAAANIAALCRTALDRPETRALNAGDPVAPTVRAIGEIISAALGVAPPTFVGLPGRPRGSVGATPRSIPKPFVMDMTAAEALGYRPVGAFSDLAAEICRATIQAAGDDWRTAFPVLAGYGYDLFDYTEEDRALNAIEL